MTKPQNVYTVEPSLTKKKKRKREEKKDIAITPEEIIATLNLKNKKNISTILTELEKLIISGKIKNTMKDIVKYLLDNKTRWS